MFAERFLFLLGIGYFAACIRVLTDAVHFLRRRSRSLLTWPPARPPYYTLRLAIGATCGILLVVAGFQHWAPTQVFGVAMMFVYYSCAVPFSRRIGRGLYEDGIWAETGFIPYTRIGGLSWRTDEPQPTLLVVSRLRNLARRLVVPGRHYAAVRRLLRDKVAGHDIQFRGTGLRLGVHDERDDV